GFTLFAPNSSAIEAIASDLASLESNTTMLQILLNNHMINGTSVYSPELVGQNYTSAAGETLSFHINSTGQYVTSGNTTALIVQPDVLLKNGVLHVIDHVLLNTHEDTGAASSAYVLSNLLPHNLLTFP
ncbi:Fasciclin-domain-containing protein, partial [Wolfiporia cocos MD-104 SS10]